MLIGARVAPFSPVGCSEGREYQESNYIQERKKNTEPHADQLTRTGCPITLFKTADLPAP